jgi:hypothetical protein
MTNNPDNESKNSSKKTSKLSATNTEEQKWQDLKAKLDQFAKDKKKEYRSHQDIFHNLVDALRREDNELGQKLTTRQLECLGWLDEHIRENKLKSLERQIQVKLQDFVRPIKGLQEDDVSIAEFYFGIDPAIGAHYQLTIVAPNECSGRMDEFGQKICDEFRTERQERLFFSCGSYG